MQRDLSLRAVRFAIALAFNPASQWIALAQAAEQAGFESVVVSDHLIYPGELQSAYPYTDDGKPRWEQATAWPDPLIAVGALAGATERLRFITSIYILTLRHPVVAAKQVATASVFSGGRLTLGVGAGWMREEFARPLASTAGRPRSRPALKSGRSRGSFAPGAGTHRWQASPSASAPWSRTPTHRSTTPRWRSSA